MDFSKSRHISPECRPQKCENTATVSGMAKERGTADDEGLKFMPH